MRRGIIDAPITGITKLVATQDLSLFSAKPATLSLCVSEGYIVKPGVIFGAVLIIIVGAIVASHQLSESGNDHFDKAGENWKQN